MRIGPPFKRLTPPLVLALLGLVFFGRLVLHPPGTLYSPHSDLIAEHIPAKQFLVRSWCATGELPLWCPEEFGGAPFVHDIQVAVFYPPHWILFLLPPEAVGPALSWLVVAHVILAGWCMYAYARAQGLGRAGATVAGIGYMFAGKWLLHLLLAGHYVLIGAAWLPLVLLLLEAAIRRGSLSWATAAGAAGALMVLGTQPQWTFYGALLGAALTLATAWETVGGVRSRGRILAALCRWFGLCLWAALVAGALSAVQLLPTLEAVGQASRGAGVAPDDAAREFLLTIRQLFGPGPAAFPQWENRAGLGVLWLTAAALAPVLCGGRVRLQAALWLALALLALGGGTLLADAGVPGFRTFRLHARAFVTAGFLGALLAGATTDALFTKAVALSHTRKKWCIFIALGVATAALAALAAGAPGVALYPTALAVLAPAAAALLVVRLCSALGLPAGRAVTLLWLGLLLLDLWAMSWPLVDVRDEKDFYAPSACISYLMGRGRDGPDGDRWRVFDTCIDGEAGHSALGEGCPLALVYGLETVGGYSPLDVHRFRDYMQFIADRPEPMAPFDDGPFGSPVFKSAPVRNKRLVDLLGVRYLLQPRDPADRPAGHVPARPPGWERRFEDDHANAYNFTRGGVLPLPPYEVWENADVLPRAFVVPEARPLSERPATLDALKRTDFRRTVLLEDWREEVAAGPAGGAYRPARITEYLPNRIAITEEGPAGWLVATDVWFPGWKCTVNGRPAEVHRGDFLFRAVDVPAGPCEIVFTFEPQSYRLGRAISLSAALFLALAAGVGVTRLHVRVPSPSH